MSTGRRLSRWRLNPLIAIALELKRRGHTPVMALPAVYRPKIEPLGLEFHALRPDIDPPTRMLVEMIYDVNKGTETGLRKFLFPVLRQTYDDLLDAATKPARADLLLLGELNYAGPIVAEVTGIPWASYVLAPFSFFSAFDPPVLPPLSKAGARRQSAGDGARDEAAGAVCDAQMAGADLRIAPRTGIAARARIRSSTPSIRRTWCWRCFRTCWAWSRRTGRSNTLITGFCFYDADAGNAALPANLEKFLAAGDAPVVFTLGSAAVLAAGDFYEQSAKAAKKLGVRAVLLIGSDERNRPNRRIAGFDLRGGVRAVFGAVSARGAGGAPGRSGDDGAVPARGEADADHALLARPAGQRAAHEEDGRGAGDPAVELQAMARGAHGAGDAGGAGV